MAGRRRGGPAASAGGEIYLEFTLIGAQRRAVAIDPASGTEVTVFGPAHVSSDELGRLAARKLARRIAADTPARRPNRDRRLA